MKQKRLLILFISLTLLILATSQETQKLDIQKIASEVKKSDSTWAEVEKLLVKGEYSGFPTIKETYGLLEEFTKSFPDICKQGMVLGKTFEERDIMVFPLTLIKVEQENELKKENGVFLNGLHHAREPMSILMCIYMYVKYVYEYIHFPQSEVHNLLSDTVIWFAPIVNADTYEFNIGYYNKSGNFSLLRKNRRPIEGCVDKTTGRNGGDGNGIDLNRNYGYKFGYDNQGSSDNQCQEDYRGPQAFSEPETQSIKNFLEQVPRMRLAVNFHAYGPLWIVPYNYGKDPENPELRHDQTPYQIINQYKQGDDFPKRIDFAFGTGIQTVNYPANGEATDWMLHERGIIAISVEVGSDGLHNDDSYDFYPSQETYLPTLQECFPPLNRWVRYVQFQPVVKKFTLLGQDNMIAFLADLYPKAMKYQSNYRVLAINIFNAGLVSIDSSQDKEDNKSNYYFQMDLSLNEEVPNVRTGVKQVLKNKIIQAVFEESQTEEQFLKEQRSENEAKFVHYVHIKETKISKYFENTLDSSKTTQFVKIPYQTFDKREYKTYYVILKTGFNQKQALQFNLNLSHKLKTANQQQQQDEQNIRLDYLGTHKIDEHSYDNIFENHTSEIVDKKEFGIDSGTMFLVALGFLALCFGCYYYQNRKEQQQITSKASQISAEEDEEYDNSHHNHSSHQQAGVIEMHDHSLSHEDHHYNQH